MIRLTAAEAFEAAARAGDADRHLHTAVLPPGSASAAAVAYGPTVLEPSASMRPDRSLLPPRRTVVPLELLSSRPTAGREKGHEAQYQRNSGDRSCGCLSCGECSNALRSGGAGW